MFELQRGEQRFDDGTRSQRRLRFAPDRDASLREEVVPRGTVFGKSAERDHDLLRRDALFQQPLDPSRDCLTFTRRSRRRNQFESARVIRRFDRTRVREEAVRDARQPRDANARQ